MADASTSPPRSLSFVIQDLNTWAGQERCTLEVARRLSHVWPVEIYAFTVDDAGLEGTWGDVTIHRVRPNVPRPELIKNWYFHAATLPPLWLRRSTSQSRETIVHAAGACSLVSDVIQVHFVQAAWKRRRGALSEELRHPPRAAAAGGWRAHLIRGYYDFLLEANVAAERMTFSRGKTYVAISDGIASELRECLGVTENVHVVRHGVDAGQFRPAGAAGEAERAETRRRLGVRDGEIAVLFVGAFDRKGLRAAIDAIALLDGGARGRLRLVAVGSGAREPYVARARQLGIEDRLVFAGYQKEIAACYRAADVFLFPTLYEPFGMVILEAMASGLPVVVSRLAGGAELIEDGVSGLLLGDPANSAEIARALSTLLADPAARSAVGLAARRAAEARSWDVVAKEYAAVLGPLMGSA